MSAEFSGKTALVTGASRSIGAAAAVALARAGCARVLVHYNGYPEGAERTAAAVRAAGAEARTLQADLAASPGIEDLAAQLPDIDILVNNAGSLIRRVGLLDYSSELFDQVMTLNFKSAWRLTQAVAPGMIRRRGGVIVNLSSIGARNGGGPGAAIYISAKAAVSAMTKGLAKELAPHGVRINAVSPGTIDNDFHQRFSTRQTLDNVIAATPAGRLGTNEDVADVIVFLCSDAARYIHGQTIEINGGLLAP